MNKDQTTIAGERTHNEHKAESEPQYPGSERGGFLYNGKTAKEWFVLHEVMRKDFNRVLRETGLTPDLSSCVDDERFEMPTPWAQTHRDVLRRALNIYSAALVPIMRHEAKTSEDNLVLTLKQVSVIQEAERYALRAINL